MKASGIRIENVESMDLLKTDGQVRKLLEDERDKLTEYICRTCKYLDEFKKIQKPGLDHFFGNTKEAPNHELTNILCKYLHIIRDYVPVEVHEEQTIDVCTYCGSYNFITSEESITCFDCCKQDDIYSIQSSYKDSNRVNVNQKYRYKRTAHFRDTVVQYQGKQNKKIPKKVYDDLTKEFRKMNIPIKGDEPISNKENYNIRISKKLIYLMLKKTGNNSYYEDIHFIHAYFTGEPLHDIHNIEKDLFKDFDKIIEIYDGMNIKRKNFLNSQYILFQLLKRYKVKVEEHDFEILKTTERLKVHDDIYKQICEQLGWTFVPLLF